MIAGRYRIENRLGVGGMSTVQLAFDERLERYVAIKLLAEHLADDPTFVSRFRREALAAARLVHPNIVQVFDFGFDASGVAYIVMEFLEGEPLDRRLARLGLLTPADALRITRLADAPRVDQPLAAGDVEDLAGPARLAAGRFSLVA